MRILIVGGTGLISSSLTQQLLEAEHEVTHFNRCQSSATVPNGVNQITGDRTRHSDFESTIRSLPPFDAVVDMICYSPADARSLTRAFRGRTGHLVMCSTVDVYAKPASRYPITEAEPHNPPPWDYAQNKEECETILWRAHAEGAFPLTILRPAYTYGEGRAFVHSFGGRSSYLDRLKKGKTIVVHGDGTSLWTACHRNDVARAFRGAIGNPVAFGKSYHLAGEEWLTWNQYHETIARAIEAPQPRLVHIPTDLLAAVAGRAHICAINFQYNNIFDNTAARTDLGFQYITPFLDGVRSCYRWLADHKHIEDSDRDLYDDRIITACERTGLGMAEQLLDLDA